MVFPNRKAKRNIFGFSRVSHMIFNLKAPPANIEKDKEYSLKEAITARMEEVGEPS